MVFNGITSCEVSSLEHEMKITVTWGYGLLSESRKESPLSRDDIAVGGDRRGSSSNEKDPLNLNSLPLYPSYH